MAMRLKAMGQPNYQNGFRLTKHERSLDLPLRWKRPKNIFVNSMSDLFHEEAPLEFVLQVFGIMNRAHWHQFQVLTKRSRRLVEASQALEWTPNIWMGVSVENAAHAFRVSDLRKTKACVKFVSFEPLLGPVSSIDLRGIDWVIVGGESGPKARKMDPRWVTDIRDQCMTAEIPFFFKQWGGFNKKKNGRLLQGRIWNEIPGICEDSQ
jgi:protein gp37